MLSHRCLLPGHQPVRWRLSLLPSSSRTPGLLSRRANGARDSIRLCAAMETTSSTHSKNRRSASTQHSGVCLEVGDLPEAGRRRRDKVHTHNDGEPVLVDKGKLWLTSGSPHGRPPDRRTGPRARYGSGARPNRADLWGPGEGSRGGARTKPPAARLSTSRTSWRRDQDTAQA